MSLLLDALSKKSPGANGKKASGSLSEITLEELPVKPESIPPPVSPPTPNPSPRSTGENLFAAKKAPVNKKFQYNLGIVPTAIIIGLILGTAGGIYVWIEIQPPKQMQYRRPLPAVAANNVTTPRTIPSLALPPEILPAAETPAKISRPAPSTEKRTRFSSVKRSVASASRSESEPDQEIRIQRKPITDDIYSSVMAAYQAYQNGDLGTAWQRYREVLIKDAKNRDALLGMAAIAQQQGQDEVAIQYYRQVLALDPRDPVAQAGMSNFSTDDAATRESKLKLSLAQSPQSSTLFFALGNLYTEQSRWSDAQQAYFNAFKIEPANAQFAFRLATSLDHLGQSKLAAQYYRQALQLGSKGNAGFDRTQTEQRLNQLLAP